MGGCYSSLNVNQRSKTCPKKNPNKQTEATDYSAKDQGSDTSVTTGKESMPKKRASKKNGNKGKKRQTASPGKVEKKKKEDKQRMRTATQVTVDTTEYTMKEKPQHSYHTSGGSTKSSLHVPTANGRTSSSVTKLPALGDRYRPSYAGLRNAGATCYMNSVIQQLYHTPEIREIICNSEISKARQDVLHQICKVFQELHAKRGCVTPRGFWNVFKLWGQPINTWEQQDAYEFFIDVTSQLDECLHDNDQPEVFKATFQGTLSDVYQCQDICIHRYEREEDFHGLTVSVTSQHLEKSLEDFVEEVALAGDNAYLCEECAQKRTAVKRTCIKTLPPVLAIQLKRFKYDSYGRIVKYSNYFTFPWIINMEPYTKKVLSHKDRMNANQDEQTSQSGLPGATCSSYFATNAATNTIDDVHEPQGYSLVGVIAHTGSVNAGHYYSLIRERGDSFDETDVFQSRWFRFNDSLVTEHTSKEVLETDCFDAIYGHSASSIGRNLRSRNAYILFYQKMDTISYMRHCSKTPSLPPIKAHLERKHSSPTKSSSDGYSTPPEHMPPLRKTESFDDLLQAIRNETLEKFFEYRGIHREDRLKKIRQAAYHQDVRPEDKVKLLHYMLDTFFRIDSRLRDELNLEEWCKTIGCILRHSDVASEAALQYLIRYRSILIVPFLLESPEEEIRRICARIIRYTLQNFLQHFKTTQLSSAQHLDIVVEELFSLMDNEARSHCKQCEQYLWVLSSYMNFDIACIRHVLCHDAFRRMMSFVLFVASIEDREDYSLTSKRYLHSMLADLLVYSDISPLRDSDPQNFSPMKFTNDELSPMSSDMAKVLLTEEEYVSYIKEAVNTYHECGAKPIAHMLQHLSFCNTAFTVGIMQALMQQIATNPFDASHKTPVFKLIKKLLEIEDPLKETRYKFVLESDNGLLAVTKACKFSDPWRSYWCIGFLIEMCKENNVIRDHLLSISTWWAFAKSWFHMAPSSFSTTWPSPDDEQIGHNAEQLTKLTIRDVPEERGCSTETKQQQEVNDFNMKISRV